MRNPIHFFSGYINTNNILLGFPPDKRVQHLRNEYTTAQKLLNQTGYALEQSYRGSIAAAGMTCLSTCLDLFDAAEEGFGKIDLDLAQMGIDMLVYSGVMDNKRARSLLREVVDREPDNEGYINERIANATETMKRAKE